MACVRSLLGISPEDTVANMQKLSVGPRVGERAQSVCYQSPLCSCTLPLCALCDARWLPVTLSDHLPLTSSSLNTKQMSQLLSWEVCLEDTFIAKAKTQGECQGRWMHYPASKQVGRSTARRGGVRPTGCPFLVTDVPVSWSS